MKYVNWKNVSRTLIALFVSSAIFVLISKPLFIFLPSIISYLLTMAFGATAAIYLERIWPWDATKDSE